MKQELHPETRLLCVMSSDIVIIGVGLSLLGMTVLFLSFVLGWNL